jgi:hypothetical protein
MTTVITGDIIGSRKVHSEVWLPELKSFFSEKKGINKWDVFRGDSFQLEAEPESAFEIALCIKALIKSTGKLDVRMAIGMGSKDFEGPSVSESYGTAFIRSGESLDAIKNTSFIIRSDQLNSDNYFNPILKLISFIADSWKPVTAATVFFALNNSGMLQKVMAQQLGKDETTISKSLKRAAYHEMVEIIDIYKKLYTHDTAAS